MDKIGYRLSSASTALSVASGECPMEYTGADKFGYRQFSCEGAWFLARLHFRPRPGLASPVAGTLWMMVPMKKFAGGRGPRRPTIPRKFATLKK